MYGLYYTCTNTTLHWYTHMISHKCLYIMLQLCSIAVFCEYHKTKQEKERKNRNMTSWRLKRLEPYVFTISNKHVFSQYRE